ncbi:MAG TPA: hypothetical protein VHF51_17350 [Solirubrobacteraceae bacterium]|nr:hypothetical protein [Solirubrobacteraceae bacterium]
MSKATLSRLTPTAAATAPRAPTSPAKTGHDTKLTLRDLAHHRAVANVLSAAGAAKTGGHDWGKRGLEHLVDAGRATADVDRFADVGSPLRSAPLLVAVPSLSLLSEDRRGAATPSEHSGPTPPTRGSRAAGQTSEFIEVATHRIRDALAYGLLVGLGFFLAAYALMRARLRFIAARETASGSFGPSAAGFGTALSSPEVAMFIAASGAALRAAPEPSSAETTTPPPRPIAVPAPAPEPEKLADDAGRSSSPRSGPWQRDEIIDGLLIGCRAADERNAILTQRVLRTLARQDPRIPSWSVVDRAARKSGETGGDWLREARRRHRGGKLRAVPSRYDADPGRELSA